MTVTTFALFKPLDKDEVERGEVEIMSVEEYKDGLALGVISIYDGTGYWCTSDMYVSNLVVNSYRPKWASHVAWYNK